MFLSSLARFAVGLPFVAGVCLVWFATLILLLPWRRARIRVCNYFSHIVGGGAIKLSGNPITINGRENIPSEPVIYVSNHTSMIDVFIGMWLTPVGTVAVAKKEIIYYPFIGQVYWLSGSLRIDRKNRQRAIDSLNAMANYTHQNKLSIFMWPEGTRSQTGRLGLFKKGVVHLALHTKLPIVPVVVHGAHRALEKGSLKLTRAPIRIDYLPPVPTEDWKLETLGDHLDELRQVFLQNLPEEQRDEPNSSTTS